MKAEKLYTARDERKAHYRVLIEANHTRLRELLLEDSYDPSSAIREPLMSCESIRNASRDLLYCLFIGDCI